MPLRYSAPLAAPGKQVVYYPGALPYPYVLAGDEAAEGAGGGWGFTDFFNTISNYFPGSQPATGETTPVEGASPGNYGLSNINLVYTFLRMFSNNVACYKGFSKIMFLN